MVHIEGAPEQDDLLVVYGRALDDLAWYGKGSVYEVAKMAKRLGRSYTIDLAERKKQFLDSKN